MCSTYFKHLLPLIDKNLKEIEIRSDILELLGELASQRAGTLIDYTTNEWFEFLGACIDPDLEDSLVKIALETLANTMNAMALNLDDHRQKLYNCIENLFASGFYEKLAKLLTERDPVLVYNSAAALNNSLVFKEEIELNMVLFFSLG